MNVNDARSKAADAAGDLKARLERARNEWISKVGDCSRFSSIPQQLARPRLLEFALDNSPSRLLAEARAEIERLEEENVTAARHRNEWLERRLAELTKIIVDAELDWLALRQQHAREVAKLEGENAKARKAAGKALRLLKLLDAGEGETARLLSEVIDSGNLVAAVRRDAGLDAEDTRGV